METTCYHPVLILQPTKAVTSLCSSAYTYTGLQKKYRYEIIPFSEDFSKHGDVESCFPEFSFLKTCKYYFYNMFTLLFNMN